MQEDVIIVHHVSDQKEEIKEKLAEVKVHKPGIIVVISVVAYFIMVLNFIVGVFMNIAHFNPDVFVNYNSIHLFAIGIHLKTWNVMSAIIVAMAAMPVIGIIGLAMTSRKGILGFWLFTVSQIVFLAIPLIISKPSDYGMVFLSLLHTIIIIPSVIAYFTYLFYFKRL
ncbi:MAG: hypothetical protein KGZ97_06935 [Bacteroidetes bacterium]|nr:hypothetical protein [Bacteroidota bacterium]